MAVHPLRPATDRRLGGPLPHQLANQTRGHLPAHKALIHRSCGPWMLCGISSRFQLLSPTGRQVPHALLTRSPLSCPRRNNSVRLACVRHAASVRPEPGSNSQKIVSQSRSFKIKFWIICLANILKNFRWLKFVYTKLKQFIYCPRCFVRLCVIQFTRYSFEACRSRGELAYVITLKSICQELFSSFFNFFRSRFAVLRPSPKR